MPAAERLSRVLDAECMLARTCEMAVCYAAIQTSVDTACMRRVWHDVCLLGGHEPRGRGFSCCVASFGMDKKTLTAVGWTLRQGLAVGAHSWEYANVLASSIHCCVASGQHRWGKSRVCVRGAGGMGSRVSCAAPLIELRRTNGEV